MAGCCSCGTEERFEGLSQRYRRVLWVVIAINAAMFGIEFAAGSAANSMALKADALDFLGDTLTYGMTLWAIGRSLRTRAGAALIKGGSLAVMGLWVLGSTIYQSLILGQPNELVMGGVALLALAANVTAALLLMRYRDGDANVRSVWLCSRNDAIGNVAVLAAAGVVALTHSAWPDLVVAGAMASLFLYSAVRIIAQALAERREAAALEAARG
jgi:Co/Zn/Cd efflux system component